MTRRRRVALAILLVPLAAAAWWLLAVAAPDTERYLAAGLPQPEDARVSAYDEVGCPPGRACLDLELSFAEGPPLRAAISLPDPLPPEPLPALLLFGGFETGRRALGLLPDPGRNAVVTYEYPLDRRAWREASLPRRFLMVQQAAHRVPRQLAALFRWVRDRPWSDDGRLSVTGVSLGALLLPAARRLASVHGEPEGYTVLAYGGVDGRAIVAANLDLRPAWLGDALAWTIAAATRAVEPARHLPHLEGPLLIVNGRDDGLIPQGSIAALHALAPEQREVVMLDGGHIDPDAEALIAELLDRVAAWLLAEGAVNPRPESRWDDQKS